MSNDRELLELAAKAYGLKKTSWWESDEDSPFPYACGIVHIVDGDPMPKCWNPLVDFGECFILSSKLHMTVSFGPIQSTASTIAGCLRGKSFTEKHCDHGWDVSRATRRAIVRAAAEIGRAME